MKTPEQLRDELAGVLLSTWAGKTYGTPHEIARASAQSIINTIAADMNEVVEALEAGKKCVNKCFVGLSDTRGISYNRNDVPKIIDKALAKLECWRKP